MALGQDPDVMLAKECEAFLAGRLAEEWGRAGQGVPPWAWLNMLAHGSVARLTSARDGGIDTLSSVTPAWALAVSLLARVALAAAEASACGLEEVQRDVLVPLELELSNAGVVGPDQLVDMVVGALNQYRR